MVEFVQYARKQNRASKPVQIGSVKGDRLPELDGLRAVAVLMVVGYHFLYRFPEYYPYPALSNSIFRFGDMGVVLFFIISGFVIAMTLKSSPSAWEFALRRFSRLWPPIAVCSAITFFVVWAIETPFTLARRAPLSGFLPSLTFLPPELWSHIVGPTDYVDGVYWSLFVEVRFYILSAFIYFCLNKKSAHLVVFIYTLITSVVYIACLGYEWRIVGRIISVLCFPQHMTFLCAGMVFYEMYSGSRSIINGAAVIVMYTLSVIMQYDIIRTILVTIFFAAFFFLVFVRPLLSPLSNSLLRWIGLTSYSIYLLHQNIGMTIITSLDKELPIPVLYGSVCLVGLFILGLASGVYFAVERRSRALAQLINSGFARR